MNPLRVIGQLVRMEKQFVFFAMLTCFCIGLEYSITRPASQSIFLSYFSSASIPYAWLWTVPLNLGVITLYNRFLPRFGPLRMMGAVVLSITCMHIASALLVPQFPWFIFIQYCWKDIYILLMFKQLWSMIHSTAISEKAKALYGIIFGSGMVGSVLGSSITAGIATKLGSEALFFLTVPIYALLFVSYFKSYRASPLKEIQERLEPKSVRASDGFSMIAKNRYLLGVLFLVVFMQVSVALIEYQFNFAIEAAIPLKDLRTAAMGKLMGIISGLSLVLQFIGTFVLLQFLGLRRSHYLVPILLCLSAFACLIYPSLAMIAFSLVLIKSIDFSVFGVIREMLFVPLQHDEKFRAKAVIDVFAYRTSKALASFLLLGVQFWVQSQVYVVSGILSIAVFILWLIAAAFLFRRSAAALS